MLTRRSFIALSATASLGSALSPSVFANDSTRASFHLGTDELAVMPVDFIGLSYEIVQLYNPDFFSAKNRLLVDLYRKLTPDGVLRLGGNLSDLARWKGDAGDFQTPKQTAAIEKGKTYWEWKLTDATVRADRDGAITPTSIRNLRGFLDAADWKLIYGLNFGSGSPERAADEAACVAREIGPRLLCFQIGNESDFFGGNHLFRQRPYTFEQEYAGLQEFAEAIRRQVPAARFGGPDVANNFTWVEQYATAQANEEANRKAVLLSGHYYAMGPASNPAMNADRLLAPNPKLDEQIVKVRRAITDSGGIPYRMTEGNSCFGGGKPGVSDSHCSALWVADYLLKLASSGYGGVNLHGGGDGIYTPIESLDADAPHPRPMYAGMQLAQLFAGLHFVSCDLMSDANITAYGAHRGKTVQQALINKSAVPVRVVSAGIPDAKPKRAWRLAATDLSATTMLSFDSIEPVASKDVLVPPYSAVVRRWIT